MVLRNVVHTLEELTLRSISDLVINRCRVLADRVCGYDAKIVNPKENELLLNFQDLSVFESVEERQHMVQEFIELYKRYLWSHVPWYMYSQVLDKVQDGIVTAVEEMKAQWKLGTNMPVFTLRVWAMVKLFDIIQNPFLQVLRVECMPKMLRSCVVRNLESFKGLKTLGLQAGNSLTPYICRGIVNMQSLASFSLKYNFTDEMLSALLACKSTLKVLDIENSRQITDLSVPSILEFSGLEELSISRTGISEEGQANILINLHNILRLPRGDYLCEALDWIAWELKPRPQPIFKIRNFWSSEVYYFHSFDQIQLVLEMCPDIQDMLFMFQDRYTCPLSVLGNFNCLTDLELWGGDFYSDDMENVLQQIGSNLTKLDLHHFESLDSQAIALISFYCTSLQHLGFSGCGFIEPTVSEEFHQTDRWRNIDIEEMLTPFLELKFVSISCSCPTSLLILILGQAVNVRKIQIGMNCAFSDEIFDSILQKNKFQFLEELEIRKSDLLTLKTVSNILLHCENIRSIMDITCWSSVTREDFLELFQHMKESNINIKLVDSIERQVSLYEICQSQLKERYQRVEWAGEY